MGILTDSPKALLVSQINATNSPTIPFTLENLYFGNPSQQPDGMSNIPIGGFLGSEYIGYSNVRTKRINLSTAVGAVPVVKSTTARTIHELLPTLSVELGFPFSKEDIKDSSIASVGVGQEANIELVAAKGSLTYYGKFIAKYQRIRILLSVALAKNSLIELRQLPTIPASRRSLEMIMYSIDFTDYKTDLKVNNKTNNWVTPVKVKAAAMANGFTDWPTAVNYQVRDVATRDEPTANKAFERVVIQTSVDIDGYNGSAYFHYNLS